MLGYNNTENVLLNNDFVRHIFIVNPIDSLKYADFLPDITIGEFITAIENYFNVVFVVDSNTNTINIINSENVITDYGTTEPIVLDNYDRVIDVESSSTPIGNAIKCNYDLGSGNTAKWQIIEPDIISKCEIKEFANWAAIKAHMIASGSGLGNKLIIYRDMSLDRDWFAMDYRSNPSVGLYGRDINRLYSMFHINKFRQYGGDTDTELPIIFSPAECTSQFKSLSFSYSNRGDVTLDCWYQLPMSRGDYYKPKDINYTFTDSVEGTINPTPRMSIFEIAVYGGRIKLSGEPYRGTLTPTIEFPMSYVDTYPDFWSFYDASTVDWFETYYKPVVTQSLRLVGDDGIIMQTRGGAIDTSYEYTFQIVDDLDVKTNRIFIIGGNKYIAISLTRQISNVQKNIVEGKFYRLK